MKKYIVIVLLLFAVTATAGSYYSATLTIAEKKSGKFRCELIVDTPHVLGSLQSPGLKPSPAKCITWGKQVLSAVDPTGSVPVKNKSYSIVSIPEKGDLEE